MSDVYVRVGGKYPADAVILERDGHFYPMGGGFVRRPLPNFHELFRPFRNAEVDKKRWVPSIFEIDCVEKKFSGYHQEESWNGWKVPYFTFAVAVDVLKAFEVQWKYDSVTDSFKHWVEGESEDSEEAVTEAGIKTPYGTLYGIGAMYWTWDEARPDTDTE